MTKRQLRTGNFILILIFIVLTVFTIRSYSSGRDLFEVLLLIDFVYFLFMVIFIPERKKRYRLSRLPLQTCNAKLLIKTNEQHRASSEYFLTFQFDDGSRILFSVSRELYGNVIEGESGELCFKSGKEAKEMFSFKPEHAHEIRNTRADRLYGRDHISD